MMFPRSILVSLSIALVAIKQRLIMVNKKSDGHHLLSRRKRRTRKIEEEKRKEKKEKERALVRAFSPSPFELLKVNQKLERHILSNGQHLVSP